MANDTHLHKNENLYIPGNERAYRIQAGKESAQILWLQMPLKDPSY
jgi:hypothetical protein